MQNTSLTLPLSGIRVLDFSRVLAGPWCSMTLGDFGAEVIKVEHPIRGDDTRDWGVRIGQTETPYFNSVNRNKRSITLDLQTPEGQQIARDLIAQSDVVIQNFKLGGIEKMGLGYEQLKSLHPQLIYCSITGYDRTGSEGARPGYDVVIQGEAGLMALNGEAQRPPLKFGVAVVDMMTGMYAAQAILAALYERKTTQKGRHIGMALYDCGVMVSAYYGLEALLMKSDPPRYGNEHPSIMPYGVFDAADGAIVIACGNNGQFNRFCNDVIERADLMQDARFKTNLDRAAHRLALMPILNAEIKKRPRLQLLERLAKAGIPCGEVAGILEALTSKRTQEAQLVQQYHHPKAGKVEIFAPPYRFDDKRLPVRQMPPELGASTDDVLSTHLGLSNETINNLRNKGVI